MSKRDTLSRALSDAPGDAEPPEVLAELGVAYVSFVLRRPTVFRLMFGNECDAENSDRVNASRALHAVLSEALEQLFPRQASPQSATGLWSLAHGIAFLHLDGKYRPEPFVDTTYMRS